LIGYRGSKPHLRSPVDTHSPFIAGGTRLQRVGQT
jgi:hypothetical protein